MKYDVVLMEKPGVDGLTKEEIIDLFGFLNGKYVYPVEIEATKVESVAMGFITTRAANELNYIYNDLNSFVANILNDMNNETQDGVYELPNYGLTIKIMR